MDDDQLLEALKAALGAERLRQRGARIIQLYLAGRDLPETEPVIDPAARAQFAAAVILREDKPGG